MNNDEKELSADVENTKAAPPPTKKARAPRTRKKVLNQTGEIPTTPPNGVNCPEFAYMANPKRTRPAAKRKQKHAIYRKTVPRRKEKMFVLRILPIQT